MRNDLMLKDTLGVLGFIAAVAVGALIINTLVFRTYSVTGPSMEMTLYTNDRLVASRLPKTVEIITGNPWTPERGQVIVLKNPLHAPGQPDQYLVKRVIGLPGERIVVQDGGVTVYNDESPDGFNPDEGIDGPQRPTSGSVDVQVPGDEIFVIGDNRIGNASFDSRSGLGTIPLGNIQGPVFVRIYPFDEMRFF